MSHKYHQNSIDAFSESSISKKYITVTIDTYETHISISVLDNAGGIEEETLKKVFEPYFSTKSKNGTGLGLYMSQIIIQDHLGGNIILHNKEQGVENFIELPYTITKDKK